MSQPKTIAFFPEAAFGPALNSVAIAQACQTLGHTPVFLTSSDMAGVYSGYGFPEYLEGCVRTEQPYTIPSFKKHQDKPLVYVSFGSLGCGDTKTLQRLIDALDQLPIRALINVGGHLDAYSSIPENLILDKWFPQPSVIPQVDAVIHHGGNNTFTECLYFAKPSIIMPYVWDGHDNATRVHETGHGLKMHRNHWAHDELARNLQYILTDSAMRQRLACTSAAMRRQPGPHRAATLLDQLLRKHPA